MTDIFKLPKSHPLYRNLRNADGTMTPTLCFAYSEDEIRSRKQLLRQLNEATDQDERDKIATKIIRLTSKPRGRRKPRGWKPAAKVGADPKEVLKQRRAVALANNPEESEVLIEFNLADAATETLRAMLSDPIFADFAADIEKRLQRREAEGDDGEGQEIAAAFGRNVPEDSFVKSCKQTSKEESAGARY